MPATVSVALDETTTVGDLNDLFSVFAKAAGKKADFSVDELASQGALGYAPGVPARAPT